MIRDLYVRSEPWRADAAGTTRTWAIALALLVGFLTSTEAAEPVELPIGDTKLFSLAYSPDGKQLALGTGGATPSVKVIEISTKKEIHDFPCEGRGAGFTVAFSPDGKLIAFGDYDLSVKVRRLQDGSEVASLPGDPDRKKYRQARRVAFGTDSKQLVVGYSTGEVFVWDLAGSKVAVRFDHGYEIAALAVSPDGKLIATGTDFGLRLWNAADGTPVVKVDVTSSGEYQVQAIAFMPDGKSVVTGDSPGFLRVIATNDGKKMAARGNGTPVSGLGITKNGESIVLPSLISGLDSKRPAVLQEGIVVMDAKYLRPRSFLATGSARLFALSPDGKTVALNTGDKGDSVMLHDLGSAKDLAPPKK